MNEQSAEIDRLVLSFLVHTDGETNSATPANELKISHHPNSQPSTGSTNNGSLGIVSVGTVYRTHGNHEVRFYVPDDEVLTVLRYKAAQFLTLHAQHTSPVDLTDRQSLSRRLGGCCGHLKHQLQRVLIEHTPRVEAHVHSNTPYERLCLACIRQRDLAERYACTTCGSRNPTVSHLKRRSAVETTQVPHPPLTWHVPMCRRCRNIIATAYLPTTPNHNKDEEVSA
jgi:hypothetical protein